MYFTSYRISALGKTLPRGNFQNYVCMLWIRAVYESPLTSCFFDGKVENRKHINSNRYSLYPLLSLWTNHTIDAANGAYTRRKQIGKWLDLHVSGQNLQCGIFMQGKSRFSFDFTGSGTLLLFFKGLVEFEQSAILLCFCSGLAKEFHADHNSRQAFCHQMPRAIFLLLLTSRMQHLICLLL